MKIILVGYGKMGKLIAESIGLAPDLDLIGIVDIGEKRSFEEITEQADAVMDFSYPGNLQMTLEYVTRTGCALVLGSTGLSEIQIEWIHEAAAHAPIVFSYNFSMGVAVLRRALELVAPALRNEFDIEIVEAHHRQKADAPSGTAKLLKAAVDPEGAFEAVDGRSGMVGARKREIGMHAIRGGTVAGEHEVLFLGDQETLAFRHSATSRQIFVNGALRAARYAVGRANGLYSMDDILWGDET